MTTCPLNSHFWSLLWQPNLMTTCPLNSHFWSLLWQPNLMTTCPLNSHCWSLLWQLNLITTCPLNSHFWSLLWQPKLMTTCPLNSHCLPTLFIVCKHTCILVMILGEILLIWRNQSRQCELLFVVFVPSHIIVLVFSVKIDIEFKLWVFSSTFKNMSLI